MDLEKQAIDILNTFSSDDPYQLGYSGGKDSDVILHLAKKSGVKFIAIHNHTTIDAPETVYYIRKKAIMGEVIIEYPKKTMWQMIVDHKSPPTRLMRYCCQELKEYSGIGKKLVTGVRKYESRNRSENQGIVTFMRPSREIKSHVDGIKQQSGIINGQMNIFGIEENSSNVNFHQTSKGGWLF